MVVALPCKARKIATMKMRHGIRYVEWRIGVINCFSPGRRSAAATRKIYSVDGRSIARSIGPGKSPKSAGASRIGGGYGRGLGPMVSDCGA